MQTFVPLENADSVVSMLSQISMFGGITEAQQDRIFGRLEIGTFKRGETIFLEGGDPTHLYIVKSGLVGLFISDKEVKIEKKRLGKGECFGHVALISINKHNLSAVAVVDSEILVFSKEFLGQLQHEDSKLFSLLILNIARELARRLQFTDDLLLKAMHGPKSGKELPRIVGQ
jgi:CRP/FNR family cyclic AMP-dependent transcriptional regulator